MELLIFSDNLEFESVFYKGLSKTPLLCEIVLRLHQVQIRGYLILHMLHISGTIMIEAVIYGLLRGVIWE